MAWGAPRASRLLVAALALYRQARDAEESERYLGTLGLAVAALSPDGIHDPEGAYRVVLAESCNQDDLDVARAVDDLLALEAETESDDDGPQDREQG